MGLVRPFALLLPDWFPGGEGAVASPSARYSASSSALPCRRGRAEPPRVGSSSRSSERIPGYAAVPEPDPAVGGESRENVWKPALVEIAEALVPAFIIEVFEDGRYTVFVSIPTPWPERLYSRAKTGASAGRALHPSFQVVSRWGSGAKGLVAAMERQAVSLSDAEAA